MASSGAQAWAKYYQGKGDLETTVKKAGPAYTEDGKTTGVALEEGTPIIVISSPSYDARPLIRVKIGGKVQTVRFGFDNIVKPGNKASGAVSLKPQAFNVVGPSLQLAAYKSRVLAALDERTDLTGPVKSYLRLLVEYWGGTATAAKKVTALYPAVKDKIPLNDINKDFGEVLGPLAVLKHNALAGTGHKVSTNSAIFIPVRPNEPLMDYKVGDVVISAKSGTTTNTVKGKDILDLLAKKTALVNKYKSTKEYQILQILTTNSTLDGPTAAVKMLLGSTGYAKWLKGNGYLTVTKKGKYTPTELNYECEKYLQTASKSGNLNYTKLFADAIRGNVVYIKFEVDSTGLGSFQAIVADDVLKAAKGARPYLRSKNGYTRAADKMGIQI